jgi:hypothetical protein
MIVAGILSGRVLNRMQKAWKMAVLGVVMASPLLGGPVFAGPPNVQHIDYIYHQNEATNPAFSWVWKEMMPLYKGTEYDSSHSRFPSNPLIGIGETDLNGDKIPDTIAFPTESEIEIGKFCKADLICPHYIFETRDDGPHLLGKIFASSIDRGDDIKNGHWTLKAYSGDWKKPQTTEYDVYEYDKKTDGYVKAPVLNKD